MVFRLLPTLPPLGTIEIRTQDDFVNQNETQIFLEAADYVFVTNPTTGLVITKEFVPPPGGVVQFRAQNSLQTPIIRTDGGTIFKSTDLAGGTIVLRYMVFIAFGGGTGQIFDIDSTSGGFVFANPIVMASTDIVGTIKGVDATFLVDSYDGNGQGLIFEDVNNGTFARVTVANGQNLVGATVLTLRGTSQKIQVSDGFVDLGSNESYLNIEPTFVVGSLTMNNMVFSGLGSVLAPGSLTWAEPEIVFKGNLGADVKNSQNIGIIGVDDNVTETALVVDVWTDLNLGGLALLGNDSELWGNVNATTGEIEYLGLEPFSGRINGDITIRAPSAPQREIWVRAVKTLAAGGPPVTLTDNRVKKTQVKLEVDTVAINMSVDVETGDKIKIQVLNHTGSTPVIIEEMDIGMTKSPV